MSVTYTAVGRVNPTANSYVPRCCIVKEIRIGNSVQIDYVNLDSSNVRDTTGQKSLAKLYLSNQNNR